MEEKFTFQEIIEMMENAEEFSELYAACDLIEDPSIRDEVSIMIGQCEDDGEDVETTYSLVTTDILDSLAMNGDKNIKVVDEKEFKDLPQEEIYELIRNGMFAGQDIETNINETVKEITNEYGSDYTEDLVRDFVSLKAQEIYANELDESKQIKTEQNNKQWYGYVLIGEYTDENNVKQKDEISKAYNTEYLKHYAKEHKEELTKYNNVYIKDTNVNEINTTNDIIDKDKRIQITESLTSVEDIVNGFEPWLESIGLSIEEADKDLLNQYISEGPFMDLEDESDMKILNKAEDILRDKYKDLSEVDYNTTLEENEETNTLEDIIKDSIYHLQGVGKDITIDNLFDDITKSYKQDYISDETIEDVDKGFDLIKQVLNRNEIEYKEKEIESMNGFKSENSTAQQLYDDFVEFENIDTSEWNKSTAEERIKMVRPQVIKFYKQNKSKIDDNWEDFMELLEYWNYHTEYKIFNELSDDDILNVNESKELKTEGLYDHCYKTNDKEELKEIALNAIYVADNDNLIIKELKSRLTDDEKKEWRDDFIGICQHPYDYIANNYYSMPLELLREIALDAVYVANDDEAIQKEIDDRKLEEGAKEELGIELEPDEELQYNDIMNTDYDLLWDELDNEDQKEYIEIAKTIRRLGPEEAFIDIVDEVKTTAKENKLDTDILAYAYLNKCNKKEESFEDFIDDNDTLNEDQKYTYMLLDRLKQDCDYYLGNGNRFDGHLWAGNVDGQIAKMKQLWNKLKEKPEWLTMEQIEAYAKKMGANELPSTVDGTAKETIQNMLDRNYEKEKKIGIEESIEKLEEDETTPVITSKLNKFYVGDPCYVLDDSIYYGIWEDNYNFQDGRIEVDNELAFKVHGTAYGDGSYEDQYGNVYGVDSGTLAVIPIELVRKEQGIKWGAVFEGDKADLNYYDGEFTISVGNKNIIIETGDEAFEDEEDTEEYDEYLDENKDLFTESNTFVDSIKNGGYKPLKYCREAGDYSFEQKMSAKEIMDIYNNLRNIYSNLYSRNMDDKAEDEELYSDIEYWEDRLKKLHEDKECLDEDYELLNELTDIEIDEDKDDIENLFKLVDVKAVPERINEILNQIKPSKEPYITAEWVYDDVRINNKPLTPEQIEQAEAEDIYITDDISNNGDKYILDPNKLYSKTIEIDGFEYDLTYKVTDYNNCVIEIYDITVEG